MNNEQVFFRNNFYHIIITALNKRDIFIENIDLLRAAFRNSKKYFEYKIIAICVLPNHVHMIIKPRLIDEYPKIITTIKYYFSRNYNVEQDSLSDNQTTRGERGVFEHKFSEYPVENKKDLINQVNYIYYNPVKHGLVKKVKDWQYSSFNRLVEQGQYNENWGFDKDDIKDIINLELE